MNLYVVRHADAVSLGNGVSSDFDRPLSDRGKTDATVMARALARIDLHVKAIFTSPLMRAVETGKIFGQELKQKPETSKRLVPGFSPDALLETLLSQSKDAGVVVIGHQPEMSIFISHLISPARAATVDMVTCAVACLELETNGTAHLRWLLTPDVVGRVNSAVVR